MKKDFRWISFVVTIAVAIFIFYMSSLPAEKTENLGPTFPFKSVIYHFAIFFILGFFLLIFLVRGKKMEYVFLGIFISLLYAIFDEVHQFFVPGRCCSFGDILTDFAGILVAGGIYFWERTYGICK
ncbi:MAG: VanZ family protein [Candidatus Pacearchaeota archaeon]